MTLMTMVISMKDKSNNSWQMSSGAKMMRENKWSINSIKESTLMVTEKSHESKSKLSFAKSYSLAARIPLINDFPLQFIMMLIIPMLLNYNFPLFVIFFVKFKIVPQKNRKIIKFSSSFFCSGISNLKSIRTICTQKLRDIWAQL